MQEFWFYIQLGLEHVLDINAYDHILFLSALAIPFTFKSWKKVLLLATIFTITHCLSLVLSVYGIVTFEVAWVEFLIPVTILLTAFFNLRYLKLDSRKASFLLQVLATGFFGLIHGFGFSNYFKMLVMGQEDKIIPLLGFASGIELSQVTTVFIVLVLAYFFLRTLKIPQRQYVLWASILILIVTLPLLYNTFPL